MLEVLANPNDEEHDEMRAWVGPWFDPERFRRGLLETYDAATSGGCDERALRRLRSGLAFEASRFKVDRVRRDRGLWRPGAPKPDDAVVTRRRVVEAVRGKRVRVC